MRLYHGSNQSIQRIDLSKGKMYKDFGRGFYTTQLYEQAVYWSKRVADRFGGTATVTEYEFDLETAISAGLNIKVFDKPDREWALFVMANRRPNGEELKREYDIIMGPVADDRMARLFGLYDMEIIDFDAVVAGLVYKDLNSQCLFATERSLDYLKKL